MESQQPQPSSPTATTDTIPKEGNGEHVVKPHDHEEHHPEESLAERFARLCTETPTTSTTSNAPSPFPDMPPHQSRYLARNASGELYMTPEAVSAAEGPHRPSVLSAFRTALAAAYGDDDFNVEASLPPPLFPDRSDPQPNDDQIPHPHPDSNLSFCALNGFPEFHPPDIDGFTWENSLSKQAIDDFLSGWQAEREAQDRLDAEDAAAAMARAAAAGAGRSRTQPRAPRPVVKRRYSFNADPVVWAAQEDAAASAVLKDLRASLGKLRKGSSKAPHESSAIWTLVKDGKGKLKPEAAAEMARAKVAAAAAAAAMREVEPEPRPEDSLQDLNGSGTGSLEKDHAEVLYEHLGPNRRANSTRNDGCPYEFVCSTSPGFPRALSLDSSTRLKNVGKQKHVAFAPGTVFVKK